jgi:alkylation response protein AidB-like acyl-CoA dehydrogenase
MSWKLATYAARVDFRDTPELAAFRAEARAWLDAHVPRQTAPESPLGMFAEHEDEPARLSRARAWQARVAEAGWAVLTWPEAYGGRDLTPLHQIVWEQEAAAFDLPTDVFGIGLGMIGPTLLTWGTDGQRDRWLRPMARGDEIWCQLFSEPEAGSDVAGLRTRATRDGDEWVVDGQKVWTSGAHYSRWGLLLARTNPAATKHAGLTMFVVDMEQPGVEVRPLRQMTGGANFNEVFFSGARVPDDQVVGGEGLGWTVALTTLMNERLSIGRILIRSQGVFERVRRLLGSAGAVAGTHPLADGRIRRRTTDVYVRGRVLDFMAQRLVTRFARGEIPTAEGAAAKLGLTALLESLSRLAVDVQGPAGTLDGPDAVDAGDWALAFTSAPGMKIAGGTDEILKDLVGRRVLGLPAEPRVDLDRAFSDTFTPPGP